MNRAESQEEGMLAPLMVSQKMKANRPTIKGMPQIRLVTTRSIARSRSNRDLSSARSTARSARRAASVYTASI
jgi:hypothetical protein